MQEQRPKQEQSDTLTVTNCQILEVIPQINISINLQCSEMLTYQLRVVLLVRWEHSNLLKDELLGNNSFFRGGKVAQFLNVTFHLFEDRRNSNVDKFESFIKFKLNHVITKNTNKFFLRGSKTYFYSISGTFSASNILYIYI